MRCAAQHMLYSSITGGVFGEDGAFDAFETALEVLRVRAALPDARQEDFRKVKEGRGDRLLQLGVRDERYNVCACGGRKQEG
jgi:hypothetical protein